MKHYRIAGLRVAMDSFGRTAKQAAPYEIEQIGEPDIMIHSNAAFIHEKHPNLSMDDCEYLSTGSDFYTKLLDHGGMMLHSSCVVLDDRAYLFTAPCGTGKSTHTSLWLKQFGDRAFILNDDKPALRMENGIWYAYGTPWSGKYDISRNAHVPVAGVAVIERGEINEVTPYGGREAIHFLLTQIVRPKSAEYRIILLEMLDKLLTNIPVWKLKCNMDLDAALVSYQAMSAHAKES